MPHPTLDHAPWVGGSHTHGYIFTCVHCGAAGVFVKQRYGVRSVLRLCEQTARAEGWSKTVDGWAHKRCVQRVRLGRDPRGPDLFSQKEQFVMGYKGTMQLIREQGGAVQQLIDLGVTHITFALLYDGEEPLVRKLAVMEHERMIPNPEKISMPVPYSELEELLVELTHDGPSGFYVVDLVGLEVFRLGEAEFVENISITPLVRPERICSLQLETDVVPNA